MDRDTPSHNTVVDLLRPDGDENRFGLAQSTFRLLVENTADGVLVVDLSGAVLYANGAAAKIFGRSCEDLLHVPLGRPLVDGDTTEITVRSPDKSPVDIELRVVEVAWNGQPALLANLRDVSAQRREEERQRQVQKLEALGRLAAGIAHDFRNLVMVVQAGLRLVGNKVRKGATADEVDALLEEILKRTQNAEALTAQLLAFSRKQELRPVAVDVNERVRSVCSMLAQTLGSTVEIRTDLHEKAGEAELDADQFDVALLNLAVNARDAMGGFGTLTIQTDIAGQSGDLRDRADLLRVTVRDTGSGMDPETKAKAFEPFFTSKGEGKGTGLGLSQVYGFVVQSGGHVRIDSEVGVGTEVHMFLPRNARAQKNPWSAEARPPIARGSPNG